MFIKHSIFVILYNKSCYCKHCNISHIIIILKTIHDEGPMTNDCVNDRLLYNSNMLI